MLESQKLFDLVSQHPRSDVINSEQVYHESFLSVSSLLHFFIKVNSE